MKKSALLVMLGAVAGYFAGYTGRPDASALAQVPSLARPGQPALAPDQPAKAIYWNVDDLRKIHAERSAASVTNKPPFEGMRTRTHSVSLLTRLHHPQPIPSNITKRMSQWDDAEEHEGISDVYVMIGGSGTMIVGGEIEKREYRPSGGPGSLLLPGEFVGQPVRGGQTYKLKTGDILAIPPSTPHQQQPDPGGMTYVLLKVNVGLYPWSISR